MYFELTMPQGMTELQILEPYIQKDACQGCGACVLCCPPALLRLEYGKATLVQGAPGCLYCGECERVCPSGAIRCPMEILVK